MSMCDIFVIRENVFKVRNIKSLYLYYRFWATTLHKKLSILFYFKVIIQILCKITSNYDPSWFLSLKVRKLLVITVLVKDFFCKQRNSLVKYFKFHIHTYIFI